MAGHVKGVAVRALLLWYEREADPNLEHLYSSLPAWCRASVSRDRTALGILPATWVPNRNYHAFVDAMLQQNRLARSRLVEGGAHAVMDATLHGIYKSLFRKFATPSLYHRYAQRAWNMYCDNGECKVDLLGTASAVARVTSWEGHHPVLCDMTVQSGKLIFEAMGKSEVTAKRESCVATGAGECRGVMRWRDE